MFECAGYTDYRKTRLPWALGDYWHGQAECYDRLERRQRILAAGFEMTRELKIEQPFDLEMSLTMGQAFRWYPLSDGWFSGVVGPHLFHVRQIEGGIEYEVTSLTGHEHDPDQCLRRYFRMDDDIDAIYASIARDPKVDTIMREFPGLRILRQDPWECLVSYICSANTGVSGTATKMEAISKSLGTSLALEGEIRHTFPSPEEIGPAGDRYLRTLGVGKPSEYIIGAVNTMLDGGFALDTLATFSYIDAKNRLMCYPGIGSKIADCIALFALDQLEAFPMDRWVWRAVTEAYPEWGFPEKAKPTDKEMREASERARLEFGEYAGYANQYLFYWRRQHGEKPLPFGTRWRGKFRITLPEGRQLDDQYLDELRYEYLKAEYLSC